MDNQAGSLSEISLGRNGLKHLQAGLSGLSAVNSISDNLNDNLQSFNRAKNEASLPVYYAD